MNATEQIEFLTRPRPIGLDRRIDRKKDLAVMLETKAAKWVVIPSAILSDGEARAFTNWPAADAYLLACINGAMCYYIRDGVAIEVLAGLLVDE